MNEWLSTNPLLERHELPPFEKIEPGHMVPAITAILKENREAIARLLDEDGEDRLDYDSLVSVREALDDRLHQAFSPISHLNAVANNVEIRAAHGTCLGLLSEYQTEMSQNEQLFKAYQRIASAEDFTGLGKERCKAVNNELRDFRLSGIDLGDADKQRFSELSKNLAQLSTDFNNNVLDATQAWSRLITDSALLQGVPANTLGLLQQKAQEKGEEGFLLTLDGPCYLAIMSHCDDAELRRGIYLAYATRASDQGPNAGDFDNSQIMLDILAARAEQAKILGFNNFAEVSVERKMAGSPSQVLEFLDDLAVRSGPIARAEYEETRAFAEERYGVIDFNPWDVAYYSEKLKKDKFDISEEELRPYFPVPVVMQGMFEVVRRLYDIEIRPANDMPTWHPDVLTYDIFRDDGRIARFYVDLYTRSTKRGGAWMGDCRVRRVEQNGNLQLPVAYLTCNFTSPVGDDPALLSHSELVTLFHEFGHGLHHMMTRVSCANVSGINGVAWDAVELPSQFMENWCWQSEALKFISGHYQTGEPLPQDMLAKLNNARNFQSAMQMVRQLEFGLFDFRLHVASNDEPPLQANIQALIDQVRTEVAVVLPPVEHRFQHAFSHIFGGGYAAGYYSYKWAEVLSADAFSKFLEDGLFNRQTGEKFLSTVLEQGGSEDAMDLFVAFMGREPSVNALLKQEGIAA
jgi:oligopeptidase A